MALATKWLRFLLLTNLGNIVHSVHDLAVLPHPVENLVAAGQVLPLAHLIHLFDRQLFISCFQTVSQLFSSCFTWFPAFEASIYSMLFGYIMLFSSFNILILTQLLSSCSPVFRLFSSCCIYSCSSCFQVLFKLFQVLLFSFSTGLQLFCSRFYLYFLAAFQLFSRFVPTGSQLFFLLKQNTYDYSCSWYFICF